MDHSVETDVAAGASAGGFLAWRRKHALPMGTPCYNCGTKLLGPWCYACGQMGEDFHRSIPHLLWEALESFFHADGRLWRTVPRLLLRPAQLTHDYLAGRRAPQVPPLRLFLVVLLFVFLAGELGTSAGRMKFVNIDTKPEDITGLNKVEVHVYKPWDAALTQWTRTHLGRAATHPDRLVAAMGDWAHDFAFLTLPISALILAMIFMFRRGFMVFDHLIFSMHSLSFQGLLFVTGAIAQWAIGNAAWFLLAASPVHLYSHMRGVYGTGRFGTLVRMAVLFTLSSMAFGIMVLGLIVVGLAALDS
jgi:hypothetical protein